MSENEMLQQHMLGEQAAPEQPPEQAPAEPMPPEQGQDPAAQNRPGEEGTPEGNKKALEIHKRFVLNVMKLASQEGEAKTQMMSYAKSTDNPAQSLGRAMLLIVSAVKKGMEAKGIQIPAQLWLQKNGLIDQSGKIIAAILAKAGIKLDAESTKQGIQMAAAGVAEEHEAQAQKGEQVPEQPAGPEGAAEPPQGAMPPEGAMPPQGAPMQAPQGGGQPMAGTPQPPQPAAPQPAAPQAQPRSNLLKEAGF